MHRLALPALPAPGFSSARFLDFPARRSVFRTSTFSLGTVPYRTDIPASPTYSVPSQKQPASRPRHPCCPWSKGGSMQRPIGVTVIAILMFLGAALLVLGSAVCFFVGVISFTGAEVRDPVTAAIVGMALAAGFSFLLLAAIYVTLGIGVLQLRETARQLCMASISLAVALTLAALFVLVLHPPASLIAAQLLFMAAYIGTLAYLVSARVRHAFTPADVAP